MFLLTHVGGSFRYYAIPTVGMNWMTARASYVCERTFRKKRIYFNDVLSYMSLNKTSYNKYAMS